MTICTPDQPGRPDRTRLGGRTALEGVALVHRADVLDGFGTLWTVYESYRTAVAQIRTSMGRARPTHAELHDVEGLTTSAVRVNLLSRDGRLSGRQVILEELVVEIQAGCGRIHEVVTAADRVWAELTSRINGCDTLLPQTQTLGSDVSLGAGRGQLNDMLRIVLHDPLRLWVNGAVARAEVDQPISQGKHIRTDLHVLAEIRQQATRCLGQVNSMLLNVGRLHEVISRKRRRVNDKILTVPVNEVRMQFSIESIRSQLTAVVECYRRGYWRRITTELPTLEQDATTVVQRAQAELFEVGQPLRVQAELRGRLSAYPAKGAQLGRIENFEPEHQYQRAHALLWRASCDLIVAAGRGGGVSGHGQCDAMNEDPA